MPAITIRITTTIITAKKEQERDLLAMCNHKGMGKSKNLSSFLGIVNLQQDLLILATFKFFNSKSTNQSKII